jgi:hypothetical protein
MIEAHLVAGLDLDAAQQTALEPVMDVVERWRIDTVAACEALGETSVGGHLDTLETLLTRTRDAVVELKPAFDGFETSLNAEQRSELAGWLDHSHGEHRSFAH